MHGIYVRYAIHAAIPTDLWDAFAQGPHRCSGRGVETAAGLRRHGPGGRDGGGVPAVLPVRVLGAIAQGLD